MKNPLVKEKNNLVVPIIFGAAAAAGLTYLFATEKGAELREKLSEGVNKGLDELKENLPQDLTELKDKVINSITAAFKSNVEEPVQEAQV